MNAFVISSQFMRKLQTDGYKGVSRWYRKVHFKYCKMVHVNTILQVNLMQQEVIFVLINHGQAHWTLLVKYSLQ